MKCYELEAIKADTHGAIEWVYPKDEVDAAIDELKSRIHELESMPHTDNSAVINALETENAELKTKLAEEREFGLNRAKSADHEIGKLCAELCELKAENRKHQRALWLARAERAKERQNYESGCRSDGWVRRENMWLEVERLCRHKAEEYK